MMVYQIFLFLVICSFHMISTELTNQDLGTVLFANVLFRHGDRTPVDPYPNDPYKNVSLWPVGFGQLTNKGKMQEYELGKWLRRRYDTFLTDKYSKETMYIQSTDVDRTLMSAESCLAGLYPPQDDQVWNPNLEWQPIPIHTIPHPLDKVLGGGYPCPAREREYKKVQKSQEIKDLLAKYSDVLKVLNDNVGKKISTLKDIEYIYDNLFIENIFNFTLPEWTKSIFPDRMKEVASYSFAMSTWNQKLARLQSGPLVKEMINHMLDKIDNKHNFSTYNFWLYSAHDSTIASFLNTLQVFDLQPPPYSAAVLVELRENKTGGLNVLVAYRNSSAEQPVLLTVPGCTTLCPLTQFVELCDSIMPKDWEKECNSFSVQDLYDIIGGFYAAAASVLFLLVVLSVASAVFYKERRKRHIHWYRKLKTDNL